MMTRVLPDLHCKHTGAQLEVLMEEIKLGSLAIEF